MRAPQASSDAALALASGRATSSAPSNGNGSSGNGSSASATNGGNGASASTLRRSILLHLRQAGPTSPDGLATALGASRTGVLQQLHALEAANLVRHATERHGVGRPRHLYDVTPDAQDLFPADYDGLAAGLLAAIAEVGGPDLIEDVFAARRRQIGHRLRQTLAGRVHPGGSVVDRVRELAVLQDEAGYLAELVIGEDGTIRLRENNCAIYHVARETSAACDAELQLFRELLGEDVVRESHIASGDRCCTYRIGSARD
ncbi:MAG: helix-turn-helix domain-containing protein [Chloroflexi bacterium]|nr:helix-turn-helix domain-containing protein [Chloroflexota bacterium]